MCAAKIETHGDAESRVATSTKVRVMQYSWLSGPRQYGTPPQRVTVMPLIDPHCRVSCSLSEAQVNNTGSKSFNVGPLLDPFDFL
jgi:hypothetical protein